MRKRQQAAAKTGALDPLRAALARFDQQLGELYLHPDSAVASDGFELQKLTMGDLRTISTALHDYVDLHKRAA